MKAKIKKLHPEAIIPEYHTSESAAFDLAILEDVTVMPGELKLLGTGLVIEAPEGHFLLIASRSSLPYKKGLNLANGIGVIDRDYSGPNDEIKMMVKNFTDKPVELKKGDRVAQGIFVRVDQVEWEETEEMRDADRGGYGSTGGYSK